MNLIDLGGKKMADPTPEEPTQTPEPMRKGVMAYGIEALELGRVIGVGLIILCAFCIYSSHRAMYLPNAGTDTISNAVASFERIELIIVGALAGIFTRK
jgi:hypothetical protein